MSKRPGTSYQIKIHFSIQTTKFLIKYNLVCFQISDRLIISFTKHDYQVSTSFMQENKRYKGLKTGKWISIWSLVSGLLLTVRSASLYCNEEKEYGIDSTLACFINCLLDNGQNFGNFMR